MRLTVLTAVFALMFWGAAPALAADCAGDSDGDGVTNCADNCIDVANPGQDDTDGDSCGNLCDGDFDQDSSTGFPDMGALSANIGTANSNFDLTEPVGDGVGEADANALTALFGTTPGPSGTTTGTLACP
jgi:hypothetical protein